MIQKVMKIQAQDNEQLSLKNFIVYYIEHKIILLYLLLYTSYFFNLLILVYLILLEQYCQQPLIN